ncbi:MAG: hypothetical protein ABWY19_13090 [Marmoricola sp.]
MSDSEATARPRQLTLAGWFVVVGSVMLVLTVYSTLAGLNSVDTRDRVAEWLSTPTGEGLGLSVAQVLSALRGVLMVTGVCAAASAVLGVFVLQRHKGARIGLSVVAVPILVATLLTAPLTGGLLGALIAAATVVLWTGPCRDWFAGRPVRQPAAPEKPAPPRPDPFAGPPPGPRVPPPQERAPEPPGPSASEVSTQSPSSLPAATAGYGEASVAQPAAPPQQWGPPTGAPIAWQAPAAGPVPMPVRVSCLLTWVFAGSIAVVYAVMLLALVVAKDEIVDYVLKSPEWQRSEIDRDLLMPVLWVGCLMFLGWSVGALLLAWFTWRRHNWARYLLAGCAAAAALAGLVAFPFSLFHVLACVLAITGLFAARSRAWFAQPTRGHWPPPGPPGGPPPGPSYGPPPPPPSQGQHRAGQGKPPVW